MKSIIILLQIALLGCLLLFLRFFLQRVQLFFSLKRFVQKYGFQLSKYPATLFIPLNSIKGNTISIETASCIYDIKVFGLLRKHCEIHFWSISEYSMEWYFSRYGLDYETHLSIGMTNERKRRPIGQFVCNTDDISGKKHTPVLLLSPANAPVSLTYRKENKFGRLHAGDRIDNVLFADLDYLLRFICNKENKDI